MESRNVQTHRAGHEAFNRRDFGAMVSKYAESITWIDRARGLTFTTPQEFENDFLDFFTRVHPAVPVVIFAPAIAKRRRCSLL